MNSTRLPPPRRGAERCRHPAHPPLTHRLVAAALIGLGGLVGTSVLAQPSLNCSIGQPANDVQIAIGESIDYVGSASGPGRIDLRWTFGGGDPDAAAGSTATVTYATAGTFTTTLTGTSNHGGSCAVTRSVDVQSAQQNARPEAADGNYTTAQDTPLTLVAPGVLGNDTDADGDPLTAVLVDDVANGTLALGSDGSFTYTPNAGFTGSDRFTYTANDAGAASNVATVTILVVAIDAASINSTSANAALSPAAVPEQTLVDDPNYTLVAINDLGMHCGDLDTRISSILPPFNVLHAQVIQRAPTRPRILGEQEVEILYSAASNPDDPAIGKVLTGEALSSLVNGTVYKTNFWDIAFGAYDPFYPDGILELFYDPNNPDANVDIGLPVPDVERLYLEDGGLQATQQAMPGLNNPYVLNEPQPFQEHFHDFPFFLSFPFGYTADGVNWFEAAGVPIAAFDDFGRENPYPLVRVEAQIGGDRVATLDTVMPISGEAECQACHADPADGGNGTAVRNLTTVTTSIEDPAAAVPGEVSVEWASDNNILRLHDRNHGAAYNCPTPDVTNPDCLDNGFDAETGASNDPVVCQRCHYTPALDLAQLGPLGPENDGSAAFPNGISTPSLANGRDQLRQPSMSNVMHSHHATVTDANGAQLFPDMPPAIDSAGNRRDLVLTRSILEQTCYLCHPGKRTQCMRGAMADGGLVCQDCHGQMAQVGDDFSRNVSPDNVGAFELAADFYTNPATPRVPWANEPGCGSCHTGDARDNLAGAAGVLVNPNDTDGNLDGIRLLAAYRTNDTKATPIVPTNKRFAENVVAEGGPADGNPKLYRVSTGHGGVMCEGCHGSTHAEWPSANPNANDNIAAQQLQGHAGTIIECSTCHATYPGTNLRGPHGMHPVGSNTFVDNHDDLADDNRNACRACHGSNGGGTVLSRVATDRVLECGERTAFCPDGNSQLFPKGHPVGCTECHENEL